MASEFVWVVVKIMVPFWSPIIIRHLIFRKKDHNFDGHPCGFCVLGSWGVVRGHTVQMSSVFFGG